MLLFFCYRKRVTFLHTTNRWIYCQEQCYYHAQFLPTDLRKEEEEEQNVIKLINAWQS